MIALLASIASAQSVDGFVEVRGQASTGVDGFPALFVERFRPELQAPLSERVTLGVHGRARVRPGPLPAGRAPAHAGGLGPRPAPRRRGLHLARRGEHRSCGSRGRSDYLSVERLYLDAYLPAVDLRVGRQAVNWGSAFLVNPTDPFPEVLLLEPWRPRAGVNAVRATVPLGERSQVQAVVGADDTLTQARLAGRATANVLGTDVSLVGAWRQEADDGLVGLDLRGTAGVGFWAEGAVHVDENPYEELAVGIDYSFAVADALVLTAQYYRNGAGTESVPTWRRG